MINFIKGDITNPHKIALGECIIIHCCNDNGDWNYNNFSRILSNRWKEAERSYRTYFRNMRLGDIKINKIDNDIYICNLLSGHCSQSSRPRPIDYSINPQKVCDYYNHKSPDVVYRQDAVDVGLRRLRQTLGSRQDVSIHISKIDLGNNWNRFYESVIRNFKDCQNNIYIYE